MSHLITVVLVVAACWFSVALVAGIALGRFIRRAGTLAIVHERTHHTPRRTVASAPADSIRVLHPAGIPAAAGVNEPEVREPLS